MKAVVWKGGHHFEVEQVPEPEPAPGQVVVKVEAAAICGSDLHMDEFGAMPPLVLGHEVAGTIHKLGAGVSSPRCGERVALDPVQRCGTCWCCTQGMEHMCMNFRHLGWAGIAGGWAEYVAVDAANAHRVPETVSFATAALTEPVAVCYESFQRAALKQGDQVLIIGDGPFGFLHAQIAAAKGAGKIIVAGYFDKRLARIRAHTKAVTCNARSEQLQEVIDAEIVEPGLDVVIEATGNGAAPHIGISNLRPRGKLVLFGFIWSPEPLDMGTIHARELELLGSCRSLKAFDPCLELMALGKVRADLLVDVEVPLGGFHEAFETMTKSKEDVFKAVLLPQA